MSEVLGANLLWNHQDAKEFSEQHPFSQVENRVDDVIYRNFPAYAVGDPLTEEQIGYYDSFEAALTATKDIKNSQSQIFYEDQVVWKSDFKI